MKRHLFSCVRSFFSLVRKYLSEPPTVVGLAIIATTGLLRCFLRGGPFTELVHLLLATAALFTIVNIWWTRLAARRGERKEETPKA